MKRRNEMVMCALALIGLSVSTSFGQEAVEFGLDILERAGRYGYCRIDTRQEVVAPRFERAFLFEGGLARVQADGKWGFINPKGEFVIPPNFDTASGFSEGFAAVGVRNADRTWAYGFIGPTGHWLVELSFRVAYPFREGLACVSLDGKKFGYIDKTGAVAIKPRFDFGEYFFEGKAVVVSAKKRGFIDTAGAVVVEPVYDHARFYREGLAPVRRDGKWGYIDHTGAVTIPFQFDDALPFRWGRASVEMDRKWVHIDRSGNPPRAE